MAPPAHTYLHTDVLVIGGGMAGCFAALTAREQGADVLLVDKGYVSTSGQTPFATCMAVYNRDWGHRLQDWLDEIAHGGEYVNDRQWTETVLCESHARLEDLLSWGVEIARDDDGEPYQCPSFGSTRCVIWEDRGFAVALRRRLEKTGVTILDRSMVTDLIVRDGAVHGAGGFNVRTGDSFVVESPATVLCAGTMSFKPIGFPIAGLTGDSDAMAYEAGARISGKEFTDPMFMRADRLGYYNLVRAVPPLEDGNDFPPLRTMSGEEIPLEIGMGRFELEAHAGKAPFFMDDLQDPDNPAVIVGGGAAGMTTPRAAGACLRSLDCDTDVPGLFAAGDSASTMQQGAVYIGLGWNMAGCSVTGARAGRAAAAYASRHDSGADREGSDALCEQMVASLRRSGGFSPAWATQLLQNTMVPYFILHIKSGPRLQAALVTVEFLRDHIVPRLYARDAHELRLAHETSNMVLNAEMRLRASLFRTESRGRHIREDYPYRDDPGWLAWTVLRKGDDGQMQLSQRPLPREWWPDLTQSYEERYPYRFPGEDAALAAMEGQQACEEVAHVD